MTYGWIKPAVDIHAPAEVNLPRRKKEHIPGLQPEKGQHHRKLTDEEVIAVIIEHLFGADVRRLAKRLGLNWTVVDHWCEGLNRRRCWIEADRRYREQLAQAAQHVERTP